MFIKNSSYEAIPFSKTCNSGEIQCQPPQTTATDPSQAEPELSQLQPWDNNSSSHGCSAMLTLEQASLSNESF